MVAHGLAFIGGSVLERFAENRLAVDVEHRTGRWVDEQNAVGAVEHYDSIGGAVQKQATVGLTPMGVSQLHQATAELVLPIDRLLKARDIRVWENHLPRALLGERAGLLTQQEGRNPSRGRRNLRAEAGVPANDVGRVTLELVQGVFAVHRHPTDHGFGPRMKALANQHDALRVAGRDQDTDPSRS